MSRVMARAKYLYLHKSVQQLPPIGDFKIFAENSSI